jgi:hypothetical protein
MKTLKITFAFFFMLLLSGCGFISTTMNNDNTMLTNVTLSQNNFSVLGQVEGVASSTYIVGFGGLSKKLYAEAKNEMIRKANLKGRARAIANVTYETHVAIYFIVETITVTATGTVIEFTD